MIVDAFTDVLHQLVMHRGTESSFELVLRHGGERLFDSYWLPRLEAGGVGIQICPLHAANAPRHQARERAVAQQAEFTRAVEENGGRVCQVRSSAELDDPRLRLVLSMEGVEPLNGDPGAFQEWHGRGVRVASLTWNEANEFAGGTATPAQGLTARGRALIRCFDELGVVLDLAHASEQTWRDVLDEGVPFSVTHACCRAVRDHPRNLADWQLEALAERGGVVGMMGLAFVVDPQAPTLSRWLDHFDHAIAVTGIEHVGLGADFVDLVADGSNLDKTALGLDRFTGPDDYPALAWGLRERGYDDEPLEAIMSGNWIRVLRSARQP